MLEQKKIITRNRMLASVINAIVIIEIIALPLLLIAIIWANDTRLLIKLVLSDFIALIATLLIYWLLCYEPK